jgi:4-hydroxybenzoate polyprenyltransferase
MIPKSWKLFGQDHAPNKDDRMIPKSWFDFSDKGLPPSSALSLPDAKPARLLFSITPAAWHPYLQLARLDRPIGWWLLVLPCWWSSLLASLVQRQPPRLIDGLLFLAGAIAMRGAGSTYNDLVDRDIDAKVERTRQRPLPSGRVSVKAAKFFIAAQALIGLAVLLCFNGFAIGLGLASLAIIAIYPFMKRIMPWPQAVLGLAFAWGALMGWAAQFGSLSASPVWLYAGAFFWIIGYDTIYALQDISDDAIIGVKSTARLFGSHVRACVGGLYGAAVLCLEISFLSSGRAGFWMQAGLAAFALQLAWQVRRIDPNETSSALQLFRANRTAGLIFLSGLAAQMIQDRLFF